MLFFLDLVSAAVITLSIGFIRGRATDNYIRKIELRLLVLSPVGY